MAASNRSSGRHLLTACIISFVCFFESYMRIPIVPLFATTLGADTVQVGMSMGVAFTVIGALIADVVPLEMRGLAMGCYNTNIYAGMMCYAVVMRTVIKGEGFQVSFFLSGIFGMLFLFLFRLLYRLQPPRRCN